MSRLKHPTPIKAGLERIGVYGTKWAAGLLVAAVLFCSTQSARPIEKHREVETGTPAWAVDARGQVLTTASLLTVNELPPAIPLQRTPPNCDPDLERPIRGACWVPLDVTPCPKGKAYVNDKGPEADGKCYARGMKAARPPTSGEPRPLGVADP